MKSMLRSTLALVASLGIASMASAAAIKGAADVGFTPPNTKVVGTSVVTIIKVKNLSKGDIAGLRIDEYWYDKAGETLPGGSKTVAMLAPGAVATVEIKTPRNPKMFKNSYQFSHSGGQVNAKSMAKID